MLCVHEGCGKIRIGEHRACPPLRSGKRSHWHAFCSSILEEAKPMPRHEIRSYDYVNHPYSRVKAALTADPIAVFRDATRSAATRVQSLAAELRVTVAGVDVITEIVVKPGRLTEETSGPYGMPTIKLPISWEAAHHPGWFPLMHATLAIYPLTSAETQLDFLGEYDPPLGAIGSAVDAVVGHRIAEASVQRFVSDVAHFLRTRLSES
jgi:hypothetical protein